MSPNTLTTGLLFGTENCESLASVYELVRYFPGFKNNNTHREPIVGSAKRSSAAFRVLYFTLFYISDVQLIHSLAGRRTPVFLPGC